MGGVEIKEKWNTYSYKSSRDPGSFLHPPPPGRFFWAKTNNEKKFRIGICYCLKEPDLGFNQNKSFLTEACLKIDTGLLLTGIIGWCIFRPTLIRYTPLLTYSKIRYTTHPTY